MGERGAFRESVWLWTPSAVQVSYCVPRLLIHASPFLLILLPTLLLWTHPCLLQKLSFIFPKDRAALLP